MRTTSDPITLPALTDDPVALRAWTLDDAAWAADAVHDVEIVRYMSIPPDQTPEGAGRWISSHAEGLDTGSSVSLLIEDADTGDRLGSVGIDRSADDPDIAEVGYWVAAPARGRGIATRAARMLIAWATPALGLRRIEITTHEDNAASRHIAESLGFREEGLLRKYREQHGRRVDLVMYALIPGEDELL